MKRIHWKIILISIVLVILQGIILIQLVLKYLPFAGRDIISSDQIIIPTITKGVVILDSPPSSSSEAFLMDEDWHYFKGNQEPPYDWVNPGFDDSNWLEGKPGFGYSDFDDRTVLDDMQGNYSSVYVRNEFVIADPNKISPLILTIDYDDGFVAYLNGIELTRSNIKGNPPSFNKLASKDRETGVPLDIFIDPGLLIAGENVVAFQVHNSSKDNNDFSIIPSLKPIQLPIELGAIWRYIKGTQAPPLDWNQVDFDDSSWRWGASGFGYADKDDTTRITDMRGNYLSIYTRNTFFVEDPGQVGILSLEIDYDDGFVAYLNGVEVLRRNISGDPPGFNTPADGKKEAGDPVFISINPSLLKTGENTLAIQIHNESKISSDLTLKAALRQVGPYLQNVTQDSIVIMWEHFGDPVSAKVRYRLQGDVVWRETSSQNIANFHEIHLTELKPGLTYQFQVSQEGKNNWLPGKPATFSTAPVSSDSYRIAAYGDSRTNYKRHTDVVKSIITNDTDLVINVGDLVDAGRDYSLWGSQFFGPLAYLMVETPLFPIVGNHEFEGTGKFWYSDFFSLPNNERWYAINYGCSRIIALDSNTDFSPGSDQHTWLLNEFGSDEFKQSTWQVVALHHPVYTSGSHKSNEQPVVEYLVPLFEEHGIDIVLSGHNHHYERSEHNGIYYIVTGGGGAELYDFPNTKLNPDSQFKAQIYNHITLDFSCSTGKVKYNAWNNWNQVFDGPIEITK